MNDDFTLNFIGIGAQRAGTTWIAQCLREHPQICLSSPKEIHFFGTNKYQFGLNWYKKHFLCQKRQIKGEFDAGYLISDKAVYQIKKHFPNVKIIVCLRNPIERVFSNYLVVAGFDQKKQTFEQDLKENPESLERGLYYKYLKRYFQLFPQENILILIYEDIKKNPLKFIQNIYRFLEVEESFIPPSIQTISNPSKKYRFPLLKRWLGQIIKRLDQHKQGIYLANFLRRIGVKKILLAIDKINSQALQKRPSINPSTRQWLREYYHQDIKNLEQLINRKLSFWQ